TLPGSHGNEAAVFSGIGGSLVVAEPRADYLRSSGRSAVRPKHPASHRREAWKDDIEGFRVALGDGHQGLGGPGTGRGLEAAVPRRQVDDAVAAVGLDLQRTAGPLMLILERQRKTGQLFGGEPDDSAGKAGRPVEAELDTRHGTLDPQGLGPS